MGTFEVTLDSCFAALMFLKLSLRPLEYGTTTKMLWFLLLLLCEFVWCYCAIVFLTKLEFQFGLKPVAHPVRIIASEECCFGCVGFPV